jgi:hypothetical protein
MQPARVLISMARLHRILLDRPVTDRANAAGWKMSRRVRDVEVVRSNKRLPGSSRSANPVTIPQKHCVRPA